MFKGSNGDEIPIEIDKEDPIEWKIYFTLNQTDYYQFSLTDENNDEQIYDIHCLAEEVDIFRNGGIEDITRLIVDRNKFQGSDVNVIVKDPFAHTIPAAFYRNSDRDLVIEYVPTKTGRSIFVKIVIVFEFLFFVVKIFMKYLFVRIIIYLTFVLYV